MRSSLNSRPGGQHQFDQRRLMENPHSDIHPAWSPDGSRIAFIGDGIFTMVADGSEQQPVFPAGKLMDWASGMNTRPSGIEDAPTWSPDGKGWLT